MLISGKQVLPGLHVIWNVDDSNIVSYFQDILLD